MSEPFEVSPGGLVAVGALYPGVERGLTADLLAARGLGTSAFPVCTALVVAGRGLVTDVTEVPEDAVRAQLEHLGATVRPAGIRIGVLGSHGSAAAVMRFSEDQPAPVVLEFVVSGPHGETVLPPRAVSTVLDCLGVADVVVVDRTDAELASGGEIRSLDDAQVAAQRIVRRGARAVLIKCGVLPARHFETDQPPGTDPFAADIFFDGRDFALFEAPYIPDEGLTGASSGHAMALAHALSTGASLEDALQSAKRHVSESLRRRLDLPGGPALDYFWDAAPNAPA
jgi:hydroxymethylpyrimidine/phosphomethylpyrimidine kinase